MYIKPQYALGCFALFARTGCGGYDSSSGGSSENSTWTNNRNNPHQSPFVTQLVVAVQKMLIVW